MPADAVIVVVFMLVVGCAAFLFGILFLIGRLIGGAGRCMMRVVRPGITAGPGVPVAPLSKVRVCPRDECRKAEHRREARFCSQCGTRLPGAAVDGKR